jgi:hypothetical protein
VRCIKLQWLACRQDRLLIAAKFRGSAKQLQQLLLLLLQFLSRVHAVC